MEATHAKSNLDLGGEFIIFYIFFDIGSNEVFVWYLIDIDLLCDIEDCFTIIIELTLFSIEALMLAN